jgi:hypothetical protein
LPVELRLLGDVFDHRPDIGRCGFSDRDRIYGFKV